MMLKDCAALLWLGWYVDLFVIGIPSYLFCRSSQREKKRLDRVTEELH